MNFTAIDFETANSHRGSICAIGMAFVTDGKIVETKHILVKPYPNNYHPINVSIHGITEKDTKNKKTFKQLWKEISPYFENKVIVAHNAAFDCSALRYALDDSKLKYPNLEYHCSYRLAQVAMDNISSHGLHEVSRHLKISLKHHQAESDARACAEITIKLCEKHKAATLQHLSSKFGFSTGKIISNQSYKAFSRR